MGKISRTIVEAINADRAQAERNGLAISDEVFELWEREIDGRLSMHGWYGSPRLIVLNGVQILDENKEQRRWPKAHGPYPCQGCSGTGHEKHALDGSRIPGAGDCLLCDGTGGLKGDQVEEMDGEKGTAPAVLPGGDKTVVLEHTISILADDFRYCGERCGYLVPGLRGQARHPACNLFDELLERELPPSLGGEMTRPRRCVKCMGASPTNVHLAEEKRV